MLPTPLLKMHFGFIPKICQVWKFITLRKKCSHKAGRDSSIIIHFTSWTDLQNQCFLRHAHGKYSYSFN